MMYKWEIYHLLTETEKKLEAIRNILNQLNTIDVYHKDKETMRIPDRIRMVLDE